MIAPWLVWAVAQTGIALFAVGVFLICFSAREGY